MLLTPSFVNPSKLICTPNISGCTIRNGHWPSKICDDRLSILK